MSWRPKWSSGREPSEKPDEKQKKLGMTKAMLIADQGIIGAGLTAPVEEALQEEGIRYVIYDKIVPNPRDFHCLEGAEFGREHEIDGMIAIGEGVPSTRQRRLEP